MSSSTNPNQSQPADKRMGEDELDAIDEALDSELIADLAGEPGPSFSEEDVSKALLLECERQGAEGIEDVSGSIP